MGEKMKKEGNVKLKDQKKVAALIWSAFSNDYMTFERSSHDFTNKTELLSM
jgi:hypothetical protein